MRRNPITSILLPLALLAVQFNQAEGVDPRRTAAQPVAPIRARDPFAIPTTVIPSPRITPPSTPQPPTTPDPIPPGVRTRTPVGTSVDSAVAASPLANPGNVTSQLLSHSDRRPPRWRLGVYSQDTDTGVKINRVVPDTPADRAGLEANDVIVAVNGFQVGIVHGEHFDCGYEFETRADADGNVMLLVQDHRNNGLVNLPLQLESRMESVTGEIAFRDRVSMPADAEVRIELREFIRHDAPLVMLANTTISDIRRIPIPFEIEYDPLDIDPRRTYMVHASIISNDRTLYTTTDQFPVITAQHGNEVAVAVVSAPQTPADSADTQRAELEAQIVAWFQQYLGREPFPHELPAWTSLVTERGRTIQEVQAELLAQDQVYNQCDRDKREYIAFLSEEIVGRPPTPEELDYWMWKFEQTGLRTDLTNDFVSSVGTPR